jgi:hypothetical protein
MLSLKKLMIFEGATVLVCTSVLLMISAEQALAFAFGAVLMTSNFFFLRELLISVLSKKSIALMTFVVVNKYAILGGLLYFAVVKLKVPMLPFFCGMLSLLTSLVLSTLIEFRAGKLKRAL